MLVVRQGATSAGYQPRSVVQPESQPDHESQIMEQKTEASQACPNNFGHPHDYSMREDGKCAYCQHDEEALQALHELVAFPPMPAPPGDYSASVRFDRAAMKQYALLYANLVVATLKAQLAPTEAQVEANKQVFENIEELRSAATAVVARWDSPKWKDEAPTADFIARLRKALQPSGNTGELMQGWDVDDLISNMGIEKEVAKARAGLQADPAIIPSLLAVQGEDSARLDAVVEANRALLHERSQLGIKKYGGTLAEKQYPHRELLTHALLEALDLSNYLQAAIMGIDRASAETGGVKS